MLHSENLLILITFYIPVGRASFFFMIYVENLKVVEDIRMRKEMESYNDLKKLAIGTATFGMNYGTFNSFGQIDINQANQILALLKI